MSKKNMFGKRNFFYSANSEAYQDAFLTWIFFNYPSKEPKNEVELFSQFMLERLLIIEKDDRVIKIEPKTQVKNADIILKITTEKSEYLIIIEDKTKSSIHSSNKKDGEIYKTQLEKYYDKFLEIEEYKNYFNEGRVFLYYYKNECVNEYEKRVIDGANDRCKELLKNQYDNEINMREKRKYKPNARKRKEDNQKAIELLKTKREKICNNYMACFREWRILDIKWIYDLFSSFEKQIGRINNQILSEYYQSIDFWNSQIDRVDSMVLFDDKDPDYLWEPQSKIWNPIFIKLMKSIKGDSPEERYNISTYSGKYWQISFTSKNNRTCILISAKHISNNSVTVYINLRNGKYGDQGLPWKEDTKERETDRKKIVEKFKELEKNNSAWVRNTTKKSENGSNDINLLAKYTANTEKTSLQFLIDTWKKVEEDLKDIEYTDFRNEKVKVFEK